MASMAGRWIGMKDGEVEAAEAEKGLSSLLLLGSTRSVRPYLSFLTLKVPRIHSRCFSTNLRDQCEVRLERLTKIARLLFQIFYRNDGDLYHEANVAMALSEVLKSLSKHPECPPPGSVDRPVFDWRPLYSKFTAACFKGADWIGYSRHGGHLLEGMASGSRVSPFTGVCRFGGQQPKNEISLQALAVLQECREVWKLVPNCTEWHLIWITLFNRILRHNADQMTEELNPLIEDLSYTFLQLLNVPTAKANCQNPDQLTWPSNCSFIVEGKKDVRKLLVFDSRIRFACTGLTICPLDESRDRKEVDSLFCFHHISEHNNQDCRRKNSAIFGPVLPSTSGFLPLDAVRTIRTHLQEGGYTKCLDMFIKM
eukprot:749106-Hanusia_phi.AAC.4